MIVQDFYIAKYDWHVRVFYAVTTYWTNTILRELERIGCTGSNLENAFRSLSSGNLNTGLTYSNFEHRLTVMVIAMTTSPEQFQNSWDHEKGHLCRHISRTFGIDPYGEEEQYLRGYIGKKMFPVSKKFLCECCRKKLIREIHGDR